MELPLALSPAGWTALGAVGGALIGATAGGIVDWLLGLRRERADAKAGARLIAGDIAAAESQFKSAEETGQWWGYFGVPINSWDRYRDVLAVKLTNDEFEAVSQAVLVLETLREKLPTSPRGSQEIAAQGFVAIRDRSSLTPVRQDAGKAYRALADLAGHKKVEELIER